MTIRLIQKWLWSLILSHVRSDSFEYIFEEHDYNKLVFVFFAKHFDDDWVKPRKSWVLFDIIDKRLHLQVLFHQIRRKQLCLKKFQIADKLRVLEIFKLKNLISVLGSSENDIFFYSFLKVFIENHQHKLGKIYIFEKQMVVQSEVLQHCNVYYFRVTESFHQWKKKINKFGLHVEKIWEIVCKNFFQNQFLILEIQLIEELVNHYNNYFLCFVELQTFFQIFKEDFEHWFLSIKGNFLII